MSRPKAVFVIVIAVGCTLSLLGVGSSPTHQLAFAAGEAVKGEVPMIQVPAGEFRMGSTAEEITELLRGHSGLAREWFNAELPQHSVYLDAFSIDKYEVTTSWYARFLKETARKGPKYWDQVDVQRHGELPVIGVSWFDAEAYCRWAAKRVPTEAQWEKAARGTDARIYPWGMSAPNSDTANYGHYGIADVSTKLYSAVLSPVGNFEKDKSPYGIFDMAGNVKEWVSDSWQPDFYRQSPYRNPIDTFDTNKKTVRGGSWSEPDTSLRVTSRGWLYGAAQEIHTGFRCAR